MLPNAADLSFFLEVANTGNMSRAAERLGVTQPALSQSMKRLETAFDQQLLLRGKGGVTLTKSGEKLFTGARGLLDEWERLKEDSARDAENLRGRYSLGLHSSVALYTVKHFVPQLLSQYPGLEFKLVHDLSRKITEDIISFKIDFGLVINPVSHPDLVIRELFKDEVCFWKSKKKTAANDMTSEDKVLIVEPDLSQSQDLLAKLAKKKITFKRIITSSNLEVIKELVISGAGIGILPGRVVGDDAKKLQVLGSQFPKFSDRLCLIYRADIQKSTASRQLTALIQEALREK
jgi:DNA-binding transcriptional LysR family regulator